MPFSLFFICSCGLFILYLCRINNENALLGLVDEVKKSQLGFGDLLTKKDMFVKNSNFLSELIKTNFCCLSSLWPNVNANKFLYIDRKCKIS